MKCLEFPAESGSLLHFQTHGVPCSFFLSLLWIPWLCYNYLYMLCFFLPKSLGTYKHYFSTYKSHSLAALPLLPGPPLVPLFYTTKSPWASPWWYLLLLYVAVCLFERDWDLSPLACELCRKRLGLLLFNWSSTACCTWWLLNNHLMTQWMLQGYWDKMCTMKKGKASLW